MSISMNTLDCVDANVWLAFAWSRHIHSEKARKWFDQTNEEKFFFCRFTQVTVLRLLTTEQVMGKDTKTMSEAWALWDRIWADDRVVFLPNWQRLKRSFARDRSLPGASPKVWADACLLGFAATAGLKLVTFDRALKSRGENV